MAASLTAAVVLATGLGLAVVDSLRNRTDVEAQVARRLQAQTDVVAAELTEIARESRTLAAASRGDGFGDAVVAAAERDPAILGAVVLDDLRVTRSAFAPTASGLASLIRPDPSTPLDIDRLDPVVAEALDAVVQRGELRLAGPLSIPGTPITLTLVADRAPAVEGVPDQRLLLTLIDVDAVLASLDGLQDMASPLTTAVRIDGGLEDLADADLDDLGPRVVRGDAAVFATSPVASAQVAGITVEVAGRPVDGWPLTSPATPMIVLPTLLGSLLAWLVVERRRTERQRLQERVEVATADLRRARARERATIDHSPDGLLDVDAGVVVSANAAAAVLLGRTPGQLVGRDIAELLGEADVLATDTREVTIGDRILVVRGSAVPSGLAEDVERRVVTLHDVTTERRSADLLLRYAQKLEQVNAQHAEVESVRRDLVAKVSHELRTPLTVIAGVAELLKQPQGERRADLVDALDRQQRRLTEQIDGLLEVAEGSRPDAEGPEAVDLAALATRVAEAVATPCTVLGHGVVHLPPTRAARVLRALLTNAIKYGAPPFTVTITTAGDRVLCDVRDEGGGIPPGSDPFQPFAQGTSGDRRTSTGLGLGLAMARRLAQDAGGDLELERRGAPTVFRLSLPRAPRSAPSAG